MGAHDRLFCISQHLIERLALTCSLNLFLPFPLFSDFATAINLPLLWTFFFFATVMENNCFNNDNMILLQAKPGWVLTICQTLMYFDECHLTPLHSGFSFASAQETEKVKQLAPNHQVNKGKASHLYLIWLQASALNQHGLPLCVNLFFLYWKKESRMGSVRWSRFIENYAC